MAQSFSPSSFLLTQILNFSNWTTCYQKLQINVDGACCIENTAEKINLTDFIDYNNVLLNGRLDDNMTTALTICTSLCRYRQSSQPVCQGFNLRFDSKTCELFRYKPIYFTRQCGCTYHALKPVDTTDLVFLPTYPYQQLLFGAKFLPSTSKTFLVQLKGSPASRSFNKSWTEFKVGFSVSDLSAPISAKSSTFAASNVGCCAGKSWNAYWLGNELLNKLTNSYTCDLHVFLNANNSKDIHRIAAGKPEFQYSYFQPFKVADERNDYKLSMITHSAGNCTTANGMSVKQGSPFSTYDVDNDSDVNVNCALAYNAGWWYANYIGDLGKCSATNFNTYFPYFLTYYPIPGSTSTYNLFSTQMWLQCF
ncbi:hypothetical protein HELRODRAFT_177161 [Helobdella robusta]|uniref:Apple domain-containing protein n=1 Tax=Helobdella robusta TaxID=6412 RepID=T1FBA6_HELRO|nr:hypothetical protein HELRODRAFT_177161 [Helobdella robusta]ESN98279.1 hypothetical protein HELRODRAFT_177161 [Helobdella robusta]